MQRHANKVMFLRARDSTHTNTNKVIVEGVKDSNTQTHQQGIFVGVRNILINITGLHGKMANWQ